MELFDYCEWNNKCAEAIGKLHTMAELRTILDNAKIPYGEINTIEKLGEDPQFQYRKCMIPITDSKSGTFQIYGSPFKFSAFDMPKKTFGSQPGEYTFPVLREILEMSDEEIVSLYADMGVDIHPEEAKEEEKS